MTDQLNALKQATEALQAVLAIANNSDGIAGWHKNGGLATWTELLPEVPGAYQAVLAAIAAQPVAPEQTWISVDERMPESGRSVLAYYLNRLGNGRRIRASWVAAKTNEAALDDDGYYDEETDTFYFPKGWYEQIDNSDEYTCIAVCEGQITHWMPLPAPPGAGPMYEQEGEQQ
jgi:hypothetical protein